MTDDDDDGIVVMLLVVVVVSAVVPQNGLNKTLTKSQRSRTKDKQTSMML